MSRPGALAPQFDDAAQQREAAALGMWVFLATETLFFGAPILVYLTARFAHAAAFAAASARLETALGVLNTAVLLTSSFTMAHADAAAERGRGPRAAMWLAATAALGVAFLAIKALEYRIDYVEGLMPFSPGFEALAEGERLFLNVYLFLTALHALHLAIGIGVVIFVAAAVGAARLPERGAARVRVTALYWHFVDIVWILLLPLLYLIK